MFLNQFYTYHKLTICFCLYLESLTEWANFYRLLLQSLSCRRFPPTLANLSNMDVVIKDGKANITANFKLLNSVLSLDEFYMLTMWMI